MIGVRVTGRVNHLLPPLSSHAHPHIHLYYNARLCLLCSGPWEKWLWLEPPNTTSTNPHSLKWNAISIGAVGGCQGDSSTSTLSRWPAWHCHLLPKNLHVSHLNQGVTQSVNQCRLLDFAKWLLWFQSHLTRYMRSEISLFRWDINGSLAVIPDLCLKRGGTQSSSSYSYTTRLNEYIMDV